MFRPLVITVTSASRRWRASEMVVVPESMMMLSPGCTSRAA
jgi:hypothetical protein